MPEEWPKICARRTTPVSPWVAVIEREVEFSPGVAPELYHAVGQADYLAIVAVTPARKIPIVRQFRPAVEAFTWELPAGLVENEEPAETCRRELLEETGLPALSVTLMGVTSPCTGRLSNRVYSYFVEAGDPIDAFVAEPGLSVKMVDAAELAALIKSGNFASQLHLGALMLAELHSFLHLPR
jgi:8-oxo-dGTP pyrophosphatase MutT (NUDIX family)